MRSPLHIPASTHGHLAATELEKSLLFVAAIYQGEQSFDPNLRRDGNGNDRATSRKCQLDFPIQYFSEHSLAFARQSIVGFSRGLCHRVRYRRPKAGNGVNS